MVGNAIPPTRTFTRAYLVLVRGSFFYSKAGLYLRHGSEDVNESEVTGWQPSAYFVHLRYCFVDANAASNKQLHFQ